LHRSEFLQLIYHRQVLFMLFRRGRNIPRCAFFGMSYDFFACTSMFSFNASDIGLACEIFFKPYCGNTRRLYSKITGTSASHALHVHAACLYPVSRLHESFTAAYGSMCRHLRLLICFVCQNHMLAKHDFMPSRAPSQAEDHSLRDVRV